MSGAAGVRAGPGRTEPALGTGHIQLLLGRPEVRFDLGPAHQFLRGKTVLVTGAAGSIGAELCAEVLRSPPGRLVAVDRCEQGIYELDERFGRSWGETRIAVALADVAHRPKMARLFAAHRPDVVFHTAAYKHVRYVEENPEDGVLNNVLGTRTVAELALEHDAAKFVLISSDKAVAPTSVMGATKRLCELLVLDLARRGRTEFLAVRFGNVVRSRGSVIPKLEAQIDEGGPMTAHPLAERYFMSMAEAVGLVLHSMAVGRSGEICIQRMGAPVRIGDIARRLLRLRGLGERDICIEPTQLLPGEKTRERLTTDAEEAAAQARGQVLVCPATDGSARVALRLDELRILAERGEREAIKGLLKELIPEYSPSATAG